MSTIVNIAAMSRIIPRLILRIIVFASAAVVLGFYDATPKLAELFVPAAVAAYGFLVIIARAGTDPRRINLAGCVIDAAAIGVLLGWGGPFSLALAPAYAVVAFDHAFHAGAKYLFLSVGLNVAAMTLAFAVSGQWQAMPIVAALYAMALSPLGYARHFSMNDVSTLDAEKRKRSDDRFAARVRRIVEEPLHDSVKAFNALLARRGLSRSERNLVTVVRDYLGCILEATAGPRDTPVDRNLAAANTTLDFDLDQILGNVLATATEVAHGRPAPWLRISPSVPRHLRGDGGRLQALLLGFAMSGSRSSRWGRQMLDVSLADERGSAVRTRICFELFCDRIITEGTSASFYTAADVLIRKLNGTIEARKDGDLESLVRIVAPFAVVGDDESPDVRLEQSALVLLVSNDRHTKAKYLAALEEKLVARSLVETVAAAIDLLQHPRPSLSRLAMIVLDRRLIVDRRGADDAARLVGIAHANAIPVVLHGDPMPDERLRIEGYAAHVGDNFQPAQLFRLIRAFAQTGYLGQFSQPSAAMPRILPAQIPAPHVLVVDDNRTVLLIIEMILKSAGYTTATATSAQEAVMLFGAQRFAATIVDLHLPREFDGLSLVSRFRADEKHLPIIVLTADPKWAAKGASADAGANAFLMKPIVPDVLLSTLINLLQSSKIVYLRAPSGEPSSPPVIDYGTLSGVGDLYHDAAELDSLVKSFNEEIGRSIENLHRAVRSNDYAAVKLTAQAIGSAALSLGARRLANVCEKIKNSEPAADTEALISSLGEIEKEFAGASEKLQDLMRARTTSPKP